MSRFPRHMSIVAAAVLVIGAAPLLASSISGFDLAWHTIDCGGGTSIGGDFELSGTIGQPDAGTMSGVGFELAGGFWIGDGGAPEPCLGDLNGNSQVDGVDLGILLVNWDAGSSAADFNGDGNVNGIDLGILLAAWGPCD